MKKYGCKSVIAFCVMVLAFGLVGCQSSVEEDEPGTTPLGTLQEGEETLFSEEQGREYVTVGPNGEVFKINVDENGRMLSQRYYDKNGVLCGRNEVIYDDVSYGPYGPMIKIVCFDNNKEQIGMVQYHAGIHHTVSIDAKQGYVLAAVEVTIGQDETIQAQFVEAEAKTVREFVYYGDEFEVTISYYDDNGKMKHVECRDGMGNLIEETRFEYVYEELEDGVRRETQFTYVDGQLSGKILYEYDSYGNCIRSTIYDAAGNVVFTTQTE
ncbi:MAG: hypothetical protein E7260_00535 [Lachnospiraceae bacterium]|nr:hypothetical protein [Lachnospiraceae bacterium]